MPLGRDDKLEATGASLDGMPLTPEDFFVFSRVDGNATVGEIIATTGLGSGAEKIIDKLIELGAVRKKKNGASAQSRGSRSRAQTPSHLRDLAAQRRKEMLRAQLKGGGAKKAAKPKKPEPEPEPEMPPDVGLPETRVKLVPENDLRINSALAIPVEHQRLVLAIHDQLGELSHFDLLGIAPTTDKKIIRRAYHQVSRKFHPDAYYGKDVGKYKSLLDQLFKRARSSYELLTDDPRREAYVQRLLAERAREEAALRQQQETKRAAREEAARLEAERKALEEQIRNKEENEKRAAERAERAERDRKRRMRQSRRMSPLEGRSKKAREHFDKGQKELDAGRPGAAASFFRLAMDLEPNNSEYHELWQSSLARARTEKATKAYEMARQFEETGRPAEAAHYFLEAAETNPLPKHLAHAALFLREDDTVRAREMALRALDGMVAAEKTGNPLKDGEAGNVHAMCGYVFLSAGQLASAKEQADAAEIKLGETDNIKALKTLIKNAKGAKKR